MPIQLGRTLQGVVYTLYIVTQLRLLHGAQDTLDIVQDVYASKGHFDDDFLPIIRKRVVVTNPQRVETIKLLLRENYAEALSVAENFLVNNVAYYQGGTVVNGVV